VAATRSALSFGGRLKIFPSDAELKYKVILTDSANRAATPAPPVTFAPPIEPGALRTIERQLHLRFHKWDTQVGDVSVLCERPLVVSGSEWDRICAAAERLAAETEQLETRTLESPRDLSDIGIPRNLREILRRSARHVNPNLRAMRFDFHPTQNGWRASEINSDVPGGWLEGTSLPQLYRPFYTGLDCPDSPLEAWGRSIESIAPKGHVALLSAPGYLEDQQVLRTFRTELESRRIASSLIQAPDALEWTQTGACTLSGSRVAVSAIIRFYQIEWLWALSSKARWRRLLESRDIPVLNPTVSAISESKRFPLLFRDSKSCPTWNALVPECRDPREISSDWDAWVLKASYSNTGDRVLLVGDLPRKQREQAIRRAQRQASEWVAQRRFTTIALETRRTPVFPCVGVFVVSGRAAGAYVRLSTHQVTDGAALEAPLLIDRNECS
jgi:glutathionylspermidine synthase